MQDIHAIGGSASAIAGASLFISGSSGGDRRLRPHSSQNNQLLKCPRCDSSNTKFCYYNNYNLSQPRHFCKSCRRYWTKGGVLRNVPVGGGCRKAKRSKTKQNSSSLEPVVVAATDRDSNSHSSSDSSSLTATTTVATTTNTVTVNSSTTVTVNSSNSPTNLLSFQQSKLFIPQINGSSGFDQNQPLISHMVSSNGQIFPETGSFTSLMTSPGDSSLLGFNFADVSAYRNQNGSLVEDHSSNHMMVTPGDEELKMEHINYGYSDQTAHIGFSSLQQNRVTIGGLAGLNWQFDGDGGEEAGGAEDQGLFDFSGSDDQAYLVQNHWSDNDPSLNFPPLV